MALIAAAAVVIAILAPALFGRRTVLPPARFVDAEANAAAAATSSWEPDLDTVWGDTAILDDDATSAAGYEYGSSDTYASVDL